MELPSGSIERKPGNGALMQIYMAVRDGMNVHEAVGAATKAVADYRAWASKQRLGG